MLSKDIILHCNEINRCNQRGGRMLSMFDLLERETITLDLSAFALYHISHGASFMVGANPGGAGKTTVMGALLNLVPANVQLLPATEQEITHGLKQNPDSKKCYICHEIGSGHWFAYLWGNNLKKYFQLLDYGNILATNLHADDIDEAHYQICIENRIPEQYFYKINLMFYLRILKGYQRRIEKVYFSTGDQKHILIYDVGKNINMIRTYISDETHFNQCLDFFKKNINKLHTIEETRSAILSFFNSTNRY